MAPSSRRGKRLEVYVPKGTVVVEDVLPKMRETDLSRLLHLRKTGLLEKVDALLIFSLIFDVINLFLIAGI